MSSGERQVREDNGDGMVAFAGRKESKIMYLINSFLMP